jgi:hypothetical protein
MIEVTLDKQQLERSLGVFRNQAPYILQTAINKTLLDAQKDIRTGINDRFTVRRQTFVKNSVKITRFAKKTDLTAVIEIADVGGRKTRDILEKFETGGVKRTTGRVAVPTSYVQPAKNRVITASRRPRNLKHSFKQRIRGNEVIMQRYNRRQVRVAYILKDTVRVDNRLGFVDTGMMTIGRVANRHLSDAITTALRTARL